MSYTERYEYKGYRIELVVDQDAQSPDDWEDPACVIVTTRNRYFEHVPKGWDLDSIRDESKQRGAFRIYRRNGVNWRVYPLYMYAHSGVALSISRQGQFSDPWDSGQVGFICINHKELKNNRATTSIEAAKGYVETWNQYLSGDVWGYIVSSLDNSVQCTCAIDESECGRHGETLSYVELDSCWGMYGKEYCQKEAEMVVNTHIQSSMVEVSK